MILLNRIRTISYYCHRSEWLLATYGGRFDSKMITQDAENDIFNEIFQNKTISRTNERSHSNCIRRWKWFLCIASDASCSVVKHLMEHMECDWSGMANSLFAFAIYIIFAFRSFVTFGVKWIFAQNGWLHVEGRTSFVYVMKIEKRIWRIWSLRHSWVP